MLSHLVHSPPSAGPSPLGIPHRPSRDRSRLESVTGRCDRVVAAPPQSRPEVRTMTTRVIATIVGSMFVLVACAGGSDLNPGFTGAVDAMQARGDCVELQAFFDRTDDVDELTYIDRALDQAGCYD